MYMYIHVQYSIPKTQRKSDKDFVMDQCELFDLLVSYIQFIYMN